MQFKLKNSISDEHNEEPKTISSALTFKFAAYEVRLVKQILE